MLNFRFSGDPGLGSDKEPLVFHKVFHQRLASDEEGM